MNYSLEPAKFARVAKQYLIEPFVYSITNAIKTQEIINYSDRLPRYVLVDASIDTGTFAITLFFKGGIKETISLEKYEIRQSNSVPKEFYISNKKNSDDYYVIIFDC